MVSFFFRFHYLDDRYVFWKAFRDTCFTFFELSRWSLKAFPPVSSQKFHRRIRTIDTGLWAVSERGAEERGESALGESRSLGEAEDEDEAFEDACGDLGGLVTGAPPPFEDRALCAEEGLRESDDALSREGSASARATTTGDALVVDARGPASAKKPVVFRASTARPVGSATLSRAAAAAVSRG